MPKIFEEGSFNTIRKTTFSQIIIKILVCFKDMSISVRLCVRFRCEWVSVSEIGHPKVRKHVCVMKLETILPHGGSEYGQGAFQRQTTRESNFRHTEHLLRC